MATSLSVRPLLAGLVLCGLTAADSPAGPGDGGTPPPAPTALQQTMITRGVPNDGFGTSVVGLGDINNDRYDDFAIGAVPLDSSGTGWAGVYFGGFTWNTTPDIILAGALPGDRYGRLVAAGDVNGDGHPDIAVAAPGADVPAQNAGRVYVYFGGPGMDSTADLILSGTGAGAALGSFLTAGGDINGDGFDDVLTGTLAQVQVFFGGSSPDTQPDLRIPVTSATAGWRSVAGGGDFNGDGFADIAIGNSDEGDYASGSLTICFGGTAPDSIPDWKIIGPYAFRYLGRTVSFPGDLNGDSFDDLAITENSRVLVLFGSPHPDSTADVGVNVFCFGLAGAGDVDGDGYSDLLVSHETGNPNLESVYVLFGGPAMDGVFDMALHPDEQAPPGPAFTSLRFGASLAAAGDLNTDGVGDFLIGAPSDDPAFLARVYVYTNTVTGTDRADRRLPGTGVDRAGTAVALADMNGDGAADILVGAWGEDGGTTGRGRAYIYKGGEDPLPPPGGGSLGWMQWTEPTATLQGNAGERFGLAVTRAGDLNGDGYEDVAVGAPFNAVNGQDAGAAYIYFGSAVFDTTADLVLRGAAWDWFGFSLSGAGDVNNDGYDDLIVGAPGNTFSGPPNNNGRALLFLGGPSMDATPDLILNGSMPGDAMGRSVAGAGDLNGDGFDDIVVGAPSNDAMGTDAGMILVYLGSSPVNSIPDLLVLGTAAEDLLGDAVAGAGDMNGDGFDDLLVGAPGSDLGAVNGGAAYVYHGGSPLTGGADQTLSGIYGDAAFGSALAGAGDVNLDGYADVVVGARQTGVPTPSSGAAQVFFGGSVPDNVPSVFMAGTTSGERFGTAVAVGDINRDGRSDVVVGAPQALRTPVRPVRPMSTSPLPRRSRPASSRRETIPRTGGDSSASAGSGAATTPTSAAG